MVAWLLVGVAAVLRGFTGDVALPIAVGMGLRLGMAVAVGAVGSSTSLRGGDETGFVGRAADLAERPIADGLWWDVLLDDAHIAIMAVQIKVLESPELALRIFHVAMAMAGILLLVAAVGRLRDARAARLAAWLLAFEPASVFFSSLLHKESVMLLAAGMVTYGVVGNRERVNVAGLVLIAFGAALAIFTRDYAGFFLLGGATLALLAATAQRAASGSVLGIGAAILVAGAVVGLLPAIERATTSERLEAVLQRTQDANTASPSANLSLEQVDFSTRGDVVRNLPVRVRDLLLRPYPWQLGNANQQLGALGAVLTVMLLLLLGRELWRRQRVGMALPLILIGTSVLFAYALSVGNAGTGFRYRTQVLAFGICIYATVRPHPRMAFAWRSEPARARTGRLSSPAFRSAEPL